MVDIQNIRNVALVGHGDSGKTSICEAMIYDVGDTNRLGDIEAGNTVLDYSEEEIARKITISTSFYPLPWKNKTITLLDTPGYADFILEAKSSIRAADGIVIVIDAVSGVEVMTEKVIMFADALDLPRLIFVNKLDRDNADFDRCLENIKETIGRPMVMTVPIGKESGFEGVVDLLDGTAWKFPGDGKAAEKTAIPADMADAVEEARQSMIETIAETDEALLEKFFADEKLTTAELNAALKKAVLKRDVLPVLCGSATKNKGIQNLMDAICELLPSPADMPPKKGTAPGGTEEIERPGSVDAPFSAFCVKTVVDPFTGRLNIIRVFSGSVTPDQQVYNSSLDKKEKMSGMLRIKGKDTEQVKELKAGEIGALVKLDQTRTNHSVSDPSNPIVYPAINYPQQVFWIAAEPKSRDDEQRMSQGLQRIAEEDPSFKFERNTETKELVISGMGQAHITVALEKLKNKFNVEVRQRPPTIPYRETIKSMVEVQGKHKKQSGGRGQFGDCWLRMEPLLRGEQFEFVNAIFGGSIPRNFIPAVEKGCAEAMVTGPVAGYPVADVKITVYDGSYHTVDSSEQAFKTAARKGFKAGFMQANPILMEPIYTIEVKVPEEFMGDIMGDLSSKRGRIQGTESKGRSTMVKALVPLKELQSYSADINSMTGGRGSFEIEFSHYEEVPPDLAQKVIEASKTDGKSEDED